MASHPDAHPDSDPAGSSESVEQVVQPYDVNRGSNEDTAGDPAGTAGTGGENKVQDSTFER